MWMLRANIKSNLTPKVDSVLKLSNYYVTTQITHVFRTKVQVFTPCSGDRPRKLAHVFCEPLPSRWRVGFCSFSFSPDIFGFVFGGDIRVLGEGDAQFPAGKKIFANGWVWAHTTRVPNFRVCLQKRREHIDFCAENMRNLRSYVVIT